MDILLCKINSFLLFNHLREITKHNLLGWALDKDVAYLPKRVTISKKSIIPCSEANQAVETMLSGGPSWIHANILLTVEEHYIITLYHGSNIGNPEPSINISLMANVAVMLID